MSDVAQAIVQAMRTIQLEEALNQSRLATSRAHVLLRNVATELEEGLKDALAIADDIHSAMG